MAIRPAPPDRDDGVGDFEHEPGAVFDRAAVVVRAVVGAVLEKLIEQVAIGAVDFHAVKAGALRILRPLAVGFHDGGEFARFQSPRGDKRALGPEQADVSPGGDGAGGDRQRSAEVARVGNAAHVPELEENPAPGGVDGLGDHLPALHLAWRPDAGCVGIANPHRCDGGGLAENQTGGGPLNVVVAHEGVGHPAGGSAAAGKRGHEDAVRQVQLAQPDRFQESASVVHIGIFASGGLLKGRRGKYEIRRGRRRAGLAMPWPPATPWALIRVRRGPEIKAQAARRCAESEGCGPPGKRGSRCP